MRSSKYYKSTFRHPHLSTRETPWFSIENYISPLTFWSTLGASIILYFIWKKMSNHHRDHETYVKKPENRVFTPMTETELEAHKQNEARRQERMILLQENYSKISNAEAEKKREAAIQRLDKKLKTIEFIKSQTDLTSYGPKRIVACYEESSTSTSQNHHNSNSVNHNSPALRKSRSGLESNQSDPKADDNEMMMDPGRSLGTIPEEEVLQQPSTSQQVASTSSADQLIAEQLQLLELDNNTASGTPSIEEDTDFISEFEFDFYTKYNRGQNLSNLKCDNICINGINWPQVIIDTGAGYSIIHERLARQGTLQKIPSSLKLVGASGEKIEIIGAIQVEISALNENDKNGESNNGETDSNDYDDPKYNFIAKHNVLVSTNIKCSLLLGCDFHRKYKLQVDFEKCHLSYNGCAPISFTFD